MQSVTLTSTYARAGIQGRLWSHDSSSVGQPHGMSLCVQSPEATSKTDTSAPPTGPTVGSKLGDAWQSVKEATGLAGDRKRLEVALRP